MLRDFVYTQRTDELHAALAQFDVQLPPEEEAIALVSFQMLSPDAFVWRLRIDNAVYYLYAEDFITDLDGVRAKIINAPPHPHALTFIPVKKPGDFASAQPVARAAIYTPPENADTMMKYASESGVDFVFLCRSDEDAGEAFFN